MEESTNSRFFFIFHVPLVQWREICGKVHRSNAGRLKRNKSMFCSQNSYQDQGMPVQLLESYSQASVHSHLMKCQCLCYSKMFFMKMTLLEYVIHNIVMLFHMVSCTAVFNKLSLLLSLSHSSFEVSKIFKRFTFVIICNKFSEIQMRYI